MSDESRLKRLGMEHLKDNPKERMRLHKKFLEETAKSDALLETQLQERLAAKGVKRQPK